MGDGPGDRTVQRVAVDCQAILRAQFRQPETGLLYTYVDAYEAGRVNLPTPEQVAADVPNANGWTTPIEDSTLATARYVDTLLAQYAVTRDRAAADRARRAVEGLVALWERSERDSFVPRGVLPGGAYYRETSIDQLSLWLLALWRFHRSPVATPADRARLERVVGAFVTSLERDGWAFRREDGAVTSWGDLLGEGSPPRSRLVLLAVLAAAYDLTGSDRWRERYREFHGTDPLGGVRDELGAKPPWVTAQTAWLVDALLAIEAPGTDRERLRTLSRDLADAALEYLGAHERYEPRRAWRDHAFRVETYHNVVHGLTVLALCHDAAPLADNRKLARRALDSYDFRRDAKEVDLLEPVARFYWRSAARGLLPYHHDVRETTVSVKNTPKSVPYRLHSKDWFDPRTREYSRLSDEAE